jgi:hypothetical protein
VTVPLGRLKKNGAPYGLAFMGTVEIPLMLSDEQKYSEPTLIRIMAAYEAAFPPRAVPEQLQEKSFLKPGFTHQFRKHSGAKKNY